MVTAARPNGWDEPSPCQHWQQQQQGEDMTDCNNYGEPVAIDGLVCEVDGCDNEADVYEDDDLRCRACASNNHGIAEPHEGGWRCMCCRIPLTVMLTDAPVAYDYTPCDTDLGDVSVTYVPLYWFKGKVRSVAVPSGVAARYQFDRYLSGSYTVVTVWPVNV